MRKKSTQTAKGKQIRKNRGSGVSFETSMFQYFNLYMMERDMKGLSYKFPDGLRCNQFIDLLIDSPDIGYGGVECKRVKNSLQNNGKLYFSTMSRKNTHTGEHQFVKQHEFLIHTGRFGIVAFRFHDMDKVVLIPHQTIYEHVIAGDLYITTEEVITNGFDISDEKASLKLFIKKYCRTK